MFPEESNLDYDPPMYRRGLYPKHLEHFVMGAKYRVRGAMCANRVGKTMSLGCYELTCHLTGLYPAWWEGRRFKKPIRAGAAGKTNKTARDILQHELFGRTVHEGNLKTVSGTGVMPGDEILSHVWTTGIADLLDQVSIQHYDAAGKKDGESVLRLRSFEQGRSAFEGTGDHVWWLDEEPPEDVMGECMTRLMTTRGLMIVTFTPLEGMSDVAMGFIPGGAPTSA